MKHVQVEYVDVESGETLSRLEVPADRVPDPLGFKPSVQLEGGHFVVVRAEPYRTHEVTARGELRLVVRRVVSDLSSADFAYRRGTLCEHLPAPARGERLEGRVLRIERDAWRQVELIDRAHAPTVLSLLRATREESKSPFPELVLREPFLPSAVPLISLEWLRGRFRDPQDYDAVTLRGLGVALERTFGLALRSGLDLYGCLDWRGYVTSLALSGVASGRHVFHDGVSLGELLDVRGLFLIDWLSDLAVDEGKKLVSYLSRGS